MYQAREYSGILLNSKWFDRGAQFIATGCFAGYSRIVPGTVGSVVGLALYLPIMNSALSIRVLATVALFCLGVLVSHRVSAIWRVKDPSVVVIDEIVGMWIALLWLPNDLVFWGGAFLLFRIFDFLKPIPARQSESLPGGWGIMMDDVFAGIYAGLAMQGLVSARWWLLG